MIPTENYHNLLDVVCFVSEFGWYNDIALVKLADDVPAAPDIVSRIQSVKLPRQESADDLSWPKDGQICTLKGWGCTEVGGGKILFLCILLF